MALFGQTGTHDITKVKNLGACLARGFGWDFNPELKVVGEQNWNGMESGSSPCFLANSYGMELKLFYV